MVLPSLYHKHAAGMPNYSTFHTVIRLYVYTALT